MIPDSIKREHILKAIEEIKRSEIPVHRDSTRYDLEYDNRLYPPKYVISLANKYANGKELDHVVFGGGGETNNFLKSRGFNIVDKEPEIDLEKQEHDFASTSKSILNFVDLQKFLLEKMKMQANYQPIMIRTLLVSGGLTNRNDIATKIRELNPNESEKDFMNIPVYEVLEKHGIVRRETTNKFVLNSEELSLEERQQLIALCNWKIENLPIQLEELILAFDKNRRLFSTDRLSDQERENMRLKFVSRFPPDKIQALQLDEYVIGKPDPVSGHSNKYTFCYEIEEGLPGFGGVGGTPAGKYGIFYSKKYKKYIYDESKYDSVQTAFTAIKSNIQTILEAAKQFVIDTNWNKLAGVIEGNFNIRRHIRSKVIAVYYPDTFLQIHSAQDIEYILDALGLKKGEISKGLILNQAKLLEIKNAHSVMKNWSNIDFSHFLWNAIMERKFADEDEKKKKQEKKPIVFSTIYDDNNLQTSKILVMDKDAIYQRIRHKCEGQKLNFELLPEDEAGQLQYGFTISSRTTKRKVYGNVLGSTMESEIWQGITKRLYDFYDSNKRRSFIVIADTPRNNFLVIPFEILKPAIYEQKSGADINKNFNIGRNPYQLLSNKLALSQYVNNLDLLFREFALDKLVDKTYLMVNEVEEIEKRLIEKGQMIFYGPPGTGKTYVAEAFGEYFTGSKENIEVVQFHPSYSYEDFIEGIRPNDLGGFSKQPGIFKRFANKCSKNRDKKFLLIIDEINRGDIAKIFGELTHLLLNRDKEIMLTYSSDIEDRFFIPSNLYIIATMNSQDRSIAFLDYAIRRRFSWIKFQPRYDILSAWLDKNSVIRNKNAIKEGLESINEIIRTRLGEDYEIGHSYFMENKLDREKLKRIIEYDIKPLVEQYFFAKKDEEFLKVIKNEYCNKMLETADTSTNMENSKAV